MCQPKDKGGRRCPAHQPASIGLKKFMSSQYGLLPEQVEHTFKGLRAQSGNRPAPTPEQYAHLIDRSKTKLQNSRLNDKEKRSVLRQLNKELTESELPDGATFYALQKLHARSREQKAEFVQAIRQVAAHQGVSRNQAYSSFKEAYAANENDYSSAFNRPFDGKTDAVMAQLLEKEGTTSTGEPKFSSEPRITREPVENSSWLTSMGYDPDDGRLEVEAHGRSYAYHNVPSETWERAQSNHGVLSSEVFHNPAYAYSSARAATNDAGGRYCEECHKYKAISGHFCNGAPDVPKDIKEAIDDSGHKNQKDRIKESLKRIEENLGGKSKIDSSTWQVPLDERETVTYQGENNASARFSDQTHIIPSLPGIRGMVREGKIVNFEVQTRISGWQVNTDVTAYIDNKDGKIKMSSSNPRCNCPIYQEKRWCEHMRKPGSRGSDVTAEQAQGEWQENFKEGLDAIHKEMDYLSYLRSNPNEDGTFNVSYNPYSSRYTDYKTLTSPHETPPEAWEATRKLLDAGETVNMSLGTVSHTNMDNFELHQVDNMKVTLKKEGDDYVVQSADVECNLCRGQCQSKSKHLGFVAEGLRSGHVRATPTIDYEHIGAAERLEALNKALEQSWAMNEEQVQEMSRFADPTGIDRSYGANIEKYVKDVRDAEKRIKKEGTVFPVVSSGVTNGACEPGTGRHFGVELEYVLDGDIPDDFRSDYMSQSEDFWYGDDEDFYVDDEDIEMAWAREVQGRIAYDLHEAGLSDIDMATEYHDYSGDRWHIEDDGSVSGEVVSPKLSDTPEHWEEVRKVLEIIKKHGGRSSRDTGGHVHMGLGRGSAAEIERRKVAATQIFSAHQDSIVRVQTDPNSKKHRDSFFCSPLSEDSAQQAIYALRNQGRLWENHNTSLNLGHHGRIEFRGGDGSLELGHIQAQVAVAASIVTAAERGELEGTKLKSSKIGSNARKTKLITRGKARAATDDELIVSDVEFRRFSDDIMNYEYGRSVIAAAAANTPWQETVRRM